MDEEAGNTCNRVMLEMQTKWFVSLDLRLSGVA